MKLTRFTSPKLHTHGPENLRYLHKHSQPQVEVLAHRDVRRRSPPRSLRVGRTSPAHTTLAMMVWLVSGVGFLCTTSCRHTPAATTTASQSIQVLVQAGPVINPSDDGQPWPTAITLYQLSGDPSAPEGEPVDALALSTRGDAAFGDLLLSRRDYTAFPDTRARIVLPLAPKTTHLVALAHFREPLGDAALLRYPVPAIPDACLYLGLEHSELDGGEFPPPGFDPAAFATSCPPPAALTPPPREPGSATHPAPSAPSAGITARPVPSDSPKPTTRPIPSDSPKTHPKPVPSDMPRSRP